MIRALVVAAIFGPSAVAVVAVAGLVGLVCKDLADDKKREAEMTKARRQIPVKTAAGEPITIPVRRGAMTARDNVTCDGCFGLIPYDWPDVVEIWPTEGPSAMHPRFYHGSCFDDTYGSYRHPHDTIKRVKA